jgi:hypothetical protein
VHHDAHIQIVSRLAGNRQEDFPLPLVAQYIQENMALFRLTAEEDPEYNRLSMLQDAGIIPVGANSFNMA